MKKTQKQQKARWMWLEQVFYKIDDLSEKLNKIESDVIELRKLYIKLYNQINKKCDSDAE